ncbi:MAG: hypothetical protein PHW24_00845 [Candidatus Moranbacteria bacterium]|nr:hypothetical protein [Candidatus Moranbacteria bacterium]
MAKENVNSLLLKSLGTKPIAFNPDLARIAGSATAGLLMSQLLYWWGKGHNKDYVYKTIEQFKEETCLTRSEQQTAIKKWEKLNVLTVKARGIPPKRRFYLNTDKLVQMLQEVAHNEKEIDGYVRTQNDGFGKSYADYDM